MEADGGRDQASRADEAHKNATSAYARAVLAKRRELAAHVRAIKRHEDAAELQERFGHPERAATAREHARHARELHEEALRQQRDLEARAPAGEEDPAPAP